MNILGYLRLFTVVAVSVVSPGNLFAQPAVAPATSVRVIEIVDPSSGNRGRQVTEDLTAAEISRIQHALASAGFDPGRATGQMSSTTRVALGRFQASRGLIPCECVSYETLVALGIRPLVVATISAPLDRGYGSEIVVLTSRHRGRGIGVGHQPAIIVGHGPSVFVGHDPARGAGEFGRRPHVRDRGSRGHPGSHVRDPRPARPRPGTRISGSGAELRSLSPPRPQPRAPMPTRP